MSQLGAIVVYQIIWLNLVQEASNFANGIVDTLDWVVASWIWRIERWAVFEWTLRISQSKYLSVPFGSSWEIHNLPHLTLFTMEPITPWTRIFMALNLAKVSSFDITDKLRGAIYIWRMNGQIYRSWSICYRFWRKKSLVKYILDMILHNRHIFIFRVDIQIKLLFQWCEIRCGKPGAWAISHRQWCLYLIVARSNLNTLGLFNLFQSLLENHLLVLWWNIVSDCLLEGLDLFSLERIDKHRKIILSLTFYCGTQF